MGLPPPRSRSANIRLTMTAFEPVRRSASSNPRPARIGTSNTAKSRVSTSSISADRPVDAGAGKARDVALGERRLPLTAIEYLIHYFTCLTVIDK